MLAHPPRYWRQQTVIKLTVTKMAKPANCCFSCHPTIKKTQKLIAVIQQMLIDAQIELRNYQTKSLIKKGDEMENLIISSVKDVPPKQQIKVDHQHIAVKDLASYCMVSTCTVRRWIRDGKLTSIKLPSNQCRVSMADFQDFLNRYNIPVREEFIYRY